MSKPIDMVCFSGFVRCILFMCLLFLMSGCAPRIFIPSEDQRDYIAFGNGGGFMGKVTTHYLLPDGELYQNTVVNSGADRMGNLSRRTYDQVCSNILNLRLTDKKTDQPGNVYKFLEWRENGVVHRWVWSDKNQAPEAELVYRNLNQFIDR